MTGLWFLAAWTVLVGTAGFSLMYRLQSGDWPWRRTR